MRIIDILVVALAILVMILIGREMLSMFNEVLKACSPNCVVLN